MAASLLFSALLCSPLPLLTRAASHSQTKGDLQEDTPGLVGEKTGLSATLGSRTFLTVGLNLGVVSRRLGARWRWLPPDGWCVRRESVVAPQQEEEEEGKNCAS